MEFSLEKAVNWTKDSYKTEWPMMGINIVSYATSLLTETSISALSTSFTDDPAYISAVATAVDYVSFWGAFLGLTAIRDKRKATTEEQRNSLARKSLANMALLTGLELTYIPLRAYGHYKLQKEGVDPALAGFLAQSVLAGGYTLILPPLRRGIDLVLGVQEGR